MFDCIENCPNLTIICLKEGLDTRYKSQTIYPSSFFTFSGNNFDYSGVAPNINYTFNGIGFGFQPTSVSMDELSKDAGTHTDSIACSFTNSDMSFDVKIPYTYTINKGSLTAKVLDASRPYGDENPAFEVAYTGFVVGENERGFIDIFNDICYRKCLTGSCNAQQRLRRHTVFDALRQLLDGLVLISRRFVLRYKLEVWHK